MKFTRRQVVILIAGVILVIALGFVFYYATRKPTTGPTITLTMWGTDDATAMSDLAAAYKGYRPNATVTYTQVDQADYEDKLLKALAAGTGPDIFEIGNRAMPRWKSAISPLPTSTYAATFNVALMQQYFPSVAASDFSTADGSIYAVPLSIDTLAMFYNKDYFDAAGIALPPTTWDDFDAAIPKLRELDAQGQIVRAAVALGGTRTSMAHANDIVSLFMLQNGVKMVSDDHTYATFADGDTTASAAVDFYLQFSNAGSPYYTWNDSMGDSLASFAAGKSAIYFGYHEDLAKIKAKAPFLNVGVAPMPQPSSASASQAAATVNYPKYLGLVAARRGQTAYAWDFIIYTTAYAAGENLYLKDTGAPAAQRASIKVQETQVADPALAVFAAQALSARSWYEGDDTQIDSIFDTMLHNILNGSQDVQAALRTAADSVTETIRNR
jgi:multiple sugar transport system substrate-binding protein